MKQSLKCSSPGLSSLTRSKGSLALWQSDLTPRTMTSQIFKAEGLSSGQICLLILISTVLLQSLCSAVTYMYFTKELKQMQEKYSRSGMACFLQDNDSSWDPSEEDSPSNPCLQMKWELQQIVRKMFLRAYEETIPTGPEMQKDIPYLGRERALPRVAAHLTGNNQRSNPLSTPTSRNEKAFGRKIRIWESSREGHSFLKNFHLRNGELVIHQTGFYYIYSQIYFRFQEEETAANRRKSKQMVQYIYKYTNYPDPILLMKSARNSCWSKDSEYGLYSIYQGGVFELKENDRIFVSVTNEQLIDMDQEASYFGAFLIA